MPHTAADQIASAVQGLTWSLEDQQPSALHRKREFLQEFELLPGRLKDDLIKQSQYLRDVYNKLDRQVRLGGTNEFDREVDLTRHPTI